MSISNEKIQKAIMEGENLLVEFKEDFGQIDDLVAEIVALANTEGGFLIFGVDDKGQIKGFKECQKRETDLTNLVRQNISPVLNIVTKITKLQDKEILVIHIPKSADRPHQTNKGVFYLRIGSTKRKASREELARMYQDVGLVSFDLSAVKGSSIQDIDQNKINQYFHQIYERDIYDEKLSLNELFKNLKILTLRENKEECTVAGLLLFGKEPEKFLPQAEIKAAKFSGKDTDTEIIDQKEIKGTLNEQIDAAENFAKNLFQRTSHLEGFKRIYKTEYPLEAVREAIVNAVAHRNYSINGAKIRFFIFNDRLEIISPGRLPNTVTLENIYYAQQTRNQLIVRFLLGLGYIEELGTGINKMVKLMKKENDTEPKFELLDESFKVTLYKK